MLQIKRVLLAFSASIIGPFLVFAILYPHDSTLQGQQFQITSGTLSMEPCQANFKPAPKKRVTLPYKPHIGTLSLSPEIDSINSLTPDNHGGNMDVPDMGPGSITYLPVRSPGARLFIGDAHACQGDGEVCGTAVEYASRTTIHVDLIKSWQIDWPRLETEDKIMVIGSARPLEDATRIAYRELVLWMAKEYGYDKWDAYMMLSQCGKVRLGNFVDPKYSVAAGVEKKYLVP